MNGNLKSYEVRWHTKQAPGHANHDGIKLVMAKNEDDAVENARNELSETYGRGRIVIDEVGRRL